MLSAAGTMLATGTLFTVTTELAVAEQPPKLVTVNVYVVVALGVTVIAGAAPPLLHVYVFPAPPPPAVRVWLWPSQIAAEDGLIVAVGVAFTVTLSVADAVQPLGPVTVTV
jgi:hypothetical protein